MKNRKPGRPAKVYKHKSPIHGEYVPAHVFYEETRAVKRLEGEIKGNNKHTINYIDNTLEELFKARASIEILIQNQFKLRRMRQSMELSS